MGKSVYVESYGCAANRCDLEIMLGCLGEAGYAIERDLESADVILLNTCGVKKPTEDKILDRLRFLRRLNKPVIVAGCLPKINLDAIQDALPNFSAAMDPHSVDQVVEAVRAAERGEVNKKFFSKESRVKPEMPKSRLNPFVEIVEIAEGCLGACSYCCTRFARGRLKSYPKESILRRVKVAVSEGVKEIWLTAQDTGAYGRDLSYGLDELVGEVVQVHGDFKVRIGMMNPNFALEMLDQLIELYRDPKVYKFAHLPLQSGSDKVLEDMKRDYTTEGFRTVVEKLRKAVPELTVATDIIVGFPTESEQDFQSTVKVLKEVKPSVVNLSKFTKRPKAPASELKQLPSEMVKRRSREVAKLCQQLSFESNQRLVGMKESMFVVEEGGRGGFIARTSNYRPVVVRGENLLGMKLRVSISRAHPGYLEGKILGLS